MPEQEDSLYEAKQRQRALVEEYQKDSMRRTSARQGTGRMAPIAAAEGLLVRLGFLLEDLGCWLQAYGATARNTRQVETVTLAEIAFSQHWSGNDDSSYHT